MKRYLLAGAATALLITSTTIASADCKEELTTLTGVAKDGSLAPLQAAPTPQTSGGTTAPATGSEGVAKDGSQIPLGTDANVAMSAEDAQAQQKGGKTAAEQAAGSPGGGSASAREEALSRAQAALDSGDEAGCMKAVEEARAL